MSVFFKNIQWKVACGTVYLNVVSEIEKMLSFELLERTHFQETFHLHRYVQYKLKVFTEKNCVLLNSAQEWLLGCF